MREITIKRLKFLFGLAFVTVTIGSYGQMCPGNQVSVSARNITATANTLEFDIFIENIGTTSLRMASCAGSMIYHDGLIPSGATATFTVVTQPTVADFPGLNVVLPAHTAITKQMRWHQPAVISLYALDLPANTLMKFARFRFTSSLPWASDAVLSFDFSDAPGGPITANQAVVYCNSNTNPIVLNAANNTLITPGVANIQVYNLLATTNSTGASQTVAFPNPFYNNFRLNMDSDLVESASIKVYDAIGKLVETREVKTAEISKQEFGNDYQSGIYNVVVSKGNDKQTIRVVKK